MATIDQLYFQNDTQWRNWLMENYDSSKGIYLVFYKVAHENDSMRWEEAVKVALCFGWIDSTVKSLGNGKRRQYFCQRKPKSVWSRVNKNYIKELLKENLMHESGLKSVKVAKENGSWTALDDVENGIIPEDLQTAFNANTEAYKNYQEFTKGQRKGYLYWLNQAKREETRNKRIAEIIEHCARNEKYRNGSGR